MRRRRFVASTTCVLKLKLLPVDHEKRSLDGQSKICNWLFNNLLERANKLKEEFKASGDTKISKILYSKRGLRNLLPALKEEKPFLKSVHSSPLKNTALRLSKSIQAFQKSRKGQRRGKAQGWPKFKSFKKQFFSLEYEEPNKGYKIQDGYLILSLGLGEKKKRHSLKIAMPDSNLLKHKNITGLRITKEIGEYFAVFTIVKDLPVAKPIARVIALDPNHKNLAYGVDNNGEAIEIQSPFWLKAYDKRMDELKSKRDRCKRRAHLIQETNDQGGVIRTYWQSSRRYQRYERVLMRAQAKRREQIKTYRNTVANALCRRYDLISIGDYAPHGGGLNTKMRRAMNNRSTIGKFKAALRWCGQKSGKTVVEWDEKGSTRTCHGCDIALPEGLDPSVRAWICPVCRLHHLRDENSAINGLRRVCKTKGAPKYIGAVPSSGPVFVKKRWAWRVLPSGVLCTPRGQDSFTKGNRQEIKLKDWDPSIQAVQSCAVHVQV